MRRRRLVPGVVIALAAACDGRSATTTTPFSVQFSVTNDLESPVTISIDTVPYAIVLGGKSTTLTVPSTVPALTWTSAKAAGSNRLPIPDDIGEVKVSVAAIGAALEISNVINDQPYITASIYNSTTAAVSIGVYDGTSVTCAAELPGATSTSVGFTRTGYYKLLAATEVRAYQAPSGCTGPFTAWPAAQIKAFAPKSGLITLTLDTAP